MSTITAVDIGNTTIKIGSFLLANNGVPDPTETSETAAKAATFDVFSDTQAADGWFGISVFEDAKQRLNEWLAANRSNELVHWLTVEDFPITVEVRFPERVGLDRVAAATAAARQKQPQNAAIIVDAGTATKVDVVADDGSFLGGTIMPGRAMMAQALCAGTDRLPEINVSNEPPNVIGRWTEAAIASGNYWGTIGAIRYLIERVRSELTTDTEVFICGGAIQSMTEHIDATAIYIPHLVLAGIAIAAEAKLRG